MVDFFKSYKDELSVDNPDIKTGGDYDKTMINVFIGFFSTSGELMNLGEGLVGVWIDPMDAMKAATSFMESVNYDPDQ